VLLFGVFTAVKKVGSAQFVPSINEIFRQQNAQFRIIDGLVTPDPGQIEAEAIEETLKNPLQTVQDHLRRSLELLAQKPQADHRNSIKEAISAVESLCKVVTVGRSADLEEALKSLDKKMPLHSTLKLTLAKLYAYASAAAGIRHGLIDEDEGKWADEEIAKFMLTSSSAFIRLITNKARSAALPPDISSELCISLRRGPFQAGTAAAASL
jgi:hypothetical protein